MENRTSKGYYHHGDYTKISYNFIVRTSPYFSVGHVEGIELVLDGNVFDLRPCDVIYKII